MMQKISEYFAMGGYAGFVWSAYGAAALILIGLLVMSWKDLRARQAEIAVLEASSPRRRHQAEGAEPS
ncbi:MAG: heme exporter protein CcmD [Proteobacteria bacterium]|nr:heme exporter protein CcmD [Pseudomonadota bacterium]MDA1323427.1 heme exporter protein CcmD [Pseudomonadota bacterium]